jgi:hypothetical protein
MEVKYKFEKLSIWQKSMAFGENIYTISNQFPKEEMYNLTSQIRGALDSIALNISEGSIGQYDFAYNLMKMLVAFKKKQINRNIKISPIFGFRLRTC